MLSEMKSFRICAGNKDKEFSLIKKKKNKVERTELHKLMFGRYPMVKLK